MRTLGERIRDARGKTSLEKLALDVGKSTQWMGEIERGSKIPTLELLLKAYDVLKPEDARDPDADLELWLLAWLKAHADKTSGADTDAVLAAVTRMHGRSKKSNKPAPTRTHLPTLEDFPEGFESESLIVVCGDRRESPPKSQGDLFVDSFSSADLISLKELFDRTGPLEVRSDKHFATGDTQYLEKEYGQKNLIVLGAPSVNLLARRINGHCVFRFFVHKDARDFLKYMEEEVPEINDLELWKVFWEMASKWKGPPDYKTIDLTRYGDYEKKFNIRKEQLAALAEKVKKALKDHTAREMKNLFRRPGFIDPAEATVQGFYTRDNDFGVVSLCPNPYSADGSRLCILVAGDRAPGTVMATRMLATGNFEGHPLGGIIEVELNPETRWVRRIPTADYGWQTKRDEGYTIEDVLSNLRNPEAHTVFDKCEPGDLASLISFIERFV